MSTETATKDKTVAVKRKTLPELLNDAATQTRFAAMLGKDSRSFAQNILTVYNGSKSLQECDPESIIAACAISASINLSILPSLGQSCVVPYKDGDRLVATWQIQWKGLIALAHRTAQYQKINLARVYEGQLVRHDEFKGTVELDASLKKSERVQGYYFYFRLNNGFVHEAYWSAKKCIEHGLRYSKSFQKGGGKWTEDSEFEKSKTVKAWLAGKEHFLTEGSGADAMSAKTAVKNDINRWGPLETRIKEIVALDQAAISNDGTPRYIDTTAETVGEAKVYTAPPPVKPGEEPTPANKIAWARDAALKQGVPNEQFDAWVAAQPGDETAKAEAATVAWKLVASKKAKAVDVFAVKKEEAKAEEQEATITVTAVASTDLDGDPDYYVVRDDSDPVVRYFTKDETVVAAAKTAKESKQKLGLKFTTKIVGKNTIRIIVALA